MKVVVTVMNRQRVVNTAFTTVNVSSAPIQKEDVISTLQTSISTAITSGDTDTALQQAALLATVNVTNATQASQLKAQAVNVISQIAKDVSSQDKAAFVINVLST